MNLIIQELLYNFRQLKVNQEHEGPQATAFERGMYRGMAIMTFNVPGIEPWEHRYLENIVKHYSEGL